MGHAAPSYNDRRDGLSASEPSSPQPGSPAPLMGADAPPYPDGDLRVDPGDRLGRSASGEDTPSVMSPEVSDAPKNTRPIPRGRLLSWLTQDIAAAHRLLRRGTATGGRGSPYRLPWFLVLGPPGAGKTSAIARSGLVFPDETLCGGRQDRSGHTLGACVWLADRAVLVDTAGALMGQPGDGNGQHTAGDNDEDDGLARDRTRLWTAVLQRLRTARRRMPLNGVILAVPLPWLAASTGDRRTAAARLLRRRLDAVYRVTGQRLPIYVWLTQADRLAGFAASFETLGGQERDQVWGFSLPLVPPGGEGTALAAVPERLDGLVQRLNARLLERLHQDPGMRQGAAIWAFPLQVASLGGPLTHFMEALFRGAAWQETLLPRAVHLVSGGVGGAPVDRLGPLLARRFGLEPLTTGAVPSSEDAGVGAKADRGWVPGWFLGRSLGSVILGEAGLVAGPPGKRQARVWRNRLAWLAGVVVLGVGVALWGKSLLANHALLAQTESVARTVQDQVQGLAVSGVADTDFAAILPPLDTLRTMPLGLEQGSAPTSWQVTLGLYQGRAVHSASITAYGEALQRLLAPRLLLALERQIVAPGDPLSADRRLAMRAYLMLGDRQAFDGEVVWSWLERLAARVLPGDDAGTEDRRYRLLRHAAAFLALGPPPMALSPALEDYARRALGPQFPYQGVPYQGGPYQAAPLRAAPAEGTPPPGGAL